MKSRIIYQYDSDGKYIQGYRTIADAAMNLSCDESTIRKRVDTSAPAVGYFWSSIQADIYPIFNNESETLTKSAVRSLKQLQKERDIHRIDGSDFRKLARVENAVEEVYEQLVDKFESIDWTYNDYEQYISKPNSLYSDEVNEGTKLIIQLSDLHLDELIDNGTGKFNINIASARLKKFADEAIRMINTYDIESVLIAFTGDIISADRLVDQMLSKASNRAIASLVATKLLAQFITYIKQNVSFVFLVNVIGNESRIADKMPYSDAAVSDNYDFIIFNQLKLILGKKKGIKFIHSDLVEAVVNVNDVNFLFLHGYNFKNDDQKYFQQVIGKYIQNDIKIDFIVFGHVHYAMITDISARSSSLVGSNDYAFRALQLSGRASQNLHIVKSDKSIINMRVDLTEYNIEDKFSIEEFMEMYRDSFAEKAKATFNKRFFVVDLEA